jgi:cobalt-zinc-cadmium efflux system outer membrane protein
MRQWLINGLSGLLLLGGCAHYAPVALTGDPGLTPPVAAVLTVESTRIARPFLRPEAVDLTRPLTPNALAVLAVLRSPDLTAARAKAGVVAAQSFAARLLPDPTLTLGYDYRYAGPDMFNGLLGQLGLDLNALRTRRVTAQGSRAAGEQVRLDIAWAEWQAAGAARLQGARVNALTVARNLDQASATATARLLDVSLHAAGRGDIAGDAVETRRLAALDASDRARVDERDLAAARFELNRLLGLPPATNLVLAATPPVVPPPPTATLDALARTARLDLQALQAGYQVQEAAVHRAVLDQFPALTLSINTARDTADNRTIGPSLAFTAPLWNRNRGGIAVASATRAQLGAEYAARLAHTTADIAAAAGVVDAALRQRDELAPAIPDLVRFAAANRRAATRGDLAVATADVAEQAVRDRQRTLVALDQAAAEGMIALELLTGAPQESWTR